MTPAHHAPPQLPSDSGFHGLGIAPKLLETLALHAFVQPTPIQKMAIPSAIEGKDVVGIAQTGTGKTLAFGIPMLQRLARAGGKGLILLPTRELALQVEETMNKIGRGAGLRTAILIGGASMRPQLDAIRKNPHVIVATPGRLIDHLDQKTLSLADVRVLVLDEADRMLDMGFLPQINRILRNVPHERQTMLFSATMPSEIVTIAQKFMKLPVRIEIARAGTAAETVTQELFVVRKFDKLRLLDHLLAEYKGSVLVFSRTKHGARKIARDLRHWGQAAAEIHSDRSLSQRREALDGFRSGKYRVLVATDVASRGIDVSGIELVINFDIPENAEDYVHRIGRTGRAGLDGKAITLATPEQGDEVRAIERLMRKVLDITPLPPLPAERAPRYEPRAEYPQRGGYGRAQRGHQRGGHGHQPQRGGYGRPAPRPSYQAPQQAEPSRREAHRPAPPAPRPTQAQSLPRTEYRPAPPAAPPAGPVHFPGLEGNITGAVGGLWPDEKPQRKRGSR